MAHRMTGAMGTSLQSLTRSPGAKDQGPIRPDHHWQSQGQTAFRQGGQQGADIHLVAHRPITRHHACRRPTCRHAPQQMITQSQRRRRAPRFSRQLAPMTQSPAQVGLTRTRDSGGGRRRRGKILGHGKIQWNGATRPLANRSSCGPREQVGAIYQDQDLDRDSPLGSSLSAPGMCCLTHFAAPVPT